MEIAIFGGGVDQHSRWAFWRGLASTPPYCMISGEEKQSHDDASRLAQHQNHELTPIFTCSSQFTRSRQGVAEPQRTKGEKITDPALGADAVGTVNPDVLGDDGALLVELQVFFKLWKC